MPRTISDRGAAASAISSSVRSSTSGNSRPVNPNAVPARMLPTIGFVTTSSAVCASAGAESSPCRAHSTDAVTSVHRIRCIEDDHQRNRRHRGFAEQHLRERNAEKHSVGEDGADGGHGLRGAVHPEKRPEEEAAGREHDHAAAEIGDEQARVHRRQPGESAHHPEEQRRDGDREHESCERGGDRRRPAQPSCERIPGEREQEKRRRQRKEMRERPHRGDRSGAPAGRAKRHGAVTCPGILRARGILDAGRKAAASRTSLRGY